MENVENTNRQPILFIVGNSERKRDIQHILEHVWKGNNVLNLEYNKEDTVYYVDEFGNVRDALLSDMKYAVEQMWLKEWKLPPKYAFLPFDKVVARNPYCEWVATFFSHMRVSQYITCDGSVYLECHPYNSDTLHLIGTKDNYTV